MSKIPVWPFPAGFTHRCEARTAAANAVVVGEYPIVSASTALAVPAIERDYHYYTLHMAVRQAESDESNDWLGVPRVDLAYEKALERAHARGPHLTWEQQKERFVASLQRARYEAALRGEADKMSA